uniref:Eukaryotic translation initiation factor 3 subunit H n=1 Tax=Cyprinus carpio carpio TaxID=630221 RepID=A0A9J7XW29_CYPCA
MCFGPFPLHQTMASRKESAASGSSPLETPVKQIQIDGLVVLKIIKHYQEEGQGSEVVQGVLLGLVVEDSLEITNCFPFPQHTEDDVDFDEVQYQMEMMRSLRHVNIDHLHVGWYQSTHYGSFVSRALLDSQFSYQHAIEESVVLIYDPIKTAQGSLCLKAYRLTPKLMEICKEKDFSPEGLKKACIGFEIMFEEVPIVIKNSHLINVLLLDLQEKSTVADKHELLNLSSSNHLEKSLQLLMDRVDDMNQDIGKYNTYCRNLSKQQQQKQQVHVLSLVCFFLSGVDLMHLHSLLNCLFKVHTAVPFQPELFRVAEMSNYMPENKNIGSEEVDWMHTHS